MPLPIDPDAHRAALERQLTLLEPLVAELDAAAIAPSPLHASGWRGRAAESAARFLGDLRTSLLLARDEVDELVTILRHLLGAYR